MNYIGVTATIYTTTMYVINVEITIMAISVLSFMFCDFFVLLFALS